MKKFFAISVMALLALAAQAQAPRYASETLTSFSYGTNYIYVGSTSNLNLAIDCRYQSTVAVAIAFQLDGTEAPVQTLTFQRSVDGSNWETLAGKKSVVGITGTSDTQSVTITNLPTYGAGFIRLASWANASTNQSVTNYIVKYSVKMNAP